jgi:hypothetical protein
VVVVANLADSSRAEATAPGTEVLAASDEGIEVVGDRVALPADSVVVLRTP